VKIGPDGNIWIPRSDNGHGFGTPNPNDVIAVYDFNGNLLRTISGGGMRDPTSMSWDSHGNIYVTGADDTFKVNVYKYDSSGNFVTSFRTAGWNLIDVYNDIEIRPDDRIYVSACGASPATIR
jgi:sugar lactone lactonase YvrE